MEQVAWNKSCFFTEEAKAKQTKIKIICRDN
jgi:hypothetical protein